MPRSGRRRSARMACAGCGLAWSAPARFCGRCGAPLRRTAARRPRPRPAFDAVPRTGGALGAAALVGVVVVFVALGLAGGDRPPDSAQEVDLDAVVPEGRGLSGEEADRALEPFEPDRLRCRPLGCERWWHPGGMAQVTPAHLPDGLVVAFDDRLAAIDTAAGDVRWTVPLEAVQPDPVTGWELRAAELVLSADGDDLLVWTPRGFLQVRDREGGERWSVTLPETRRLWEVELTADTVVVASSANSANRPIEVVTGFDRQHGTVRWRQRVRWTYGAGADGPLVRTADGRVARLDPATGRPAFHLDVDEPRWVSTAGAFFVARVEDRTVVLLDRATGEVVRKVENATNVADLREPAGGIALLVAGRHADEDDVPTQVIAVDRDGSTRWERAVGCCPTLVSSPAQTVAVRKLGGEPPLVLAADDGATLDVPPAGTGELRWLSDDLLVTTRSDPPVLVGRDGSRIALDGARARVVSVDPLVVASPDGLLGIDRSAAARAARPSPKQDAERGSRTMAQGPALPDERSTRPVDGPSIRRR
jgi:outer membrane protein assembly factor BamB